MSRVIDSFSGRVRRVQDSARTTRAAVTRPKPPVRIELGRSVRAWWLQLLIIALGIAAIIALHPGVVAIVLISIALAPAAIRPGTTSGAIFCAMLGVIWLIDPTPAFSVRSFALLAIGPAVWTVAGTLTGLPLRTRIELIALRPALLRWVVLQVISQPLLVGAELLAGHRPGYQALGPALIAFGAAVLVAVAAWLLLPRITAGDQPPRRPRS
jgi:hypothetical protein